MAGSEGECDVCKGNLILKENKEVGGTKYKILKCEKCNKQVARHES